MISQGTDPLATVHYRSFFLRPGHLSQQEGKVGIVPGCCNTHLQTPRDSVSGSRLSTADCPRTVICLLVRLHDLYNQDHTRYARSGLIYRPTLDTHLTPPIVTLTHTIHVMYALQEAVQGIDEFHFIHDDSHHQVATFSGKPAAEKPT